MLSLYNIFGVALMSYIGSFQSTSFNEYPEYFRSDCFFNGLSYDLVRTDNLNEVRLNINYSLILENYFFDALEYKNLPDLEKEDYKGLYSKLIIDNLSTSSSIFISNDLLSKVGYDFMSNLYYVNISLQNYNYNLSANETELDLNFSCDVFLDIRFLYYSNNNYFSLSFNKTFNNLINVNYKYVVSDGLNTDLNNSLEYYFTKQEVSDSIDRVYINTHFNSLLLDNYKQVEYNLSNVYNAEKNGFDKGREVGFNEGLKKSLNDVNPITLAFNGISNVLNIEIFPGFKLAYGIMFALMVMLVRFALSFFK